MPSHDSDGQPADILDGRGDSTATSEIRRGNGDGAVKSRKTPPTEGLVAVVHDRLVRFLDFLVVKSFTLVGPVSVGRSVESLRVYVEVIPHEITDIVREPFPHVAERCGTIDDLIGYESLNDAIFNAEHVGSSILGDVIPQNLLIVFGQTLQSLDDALVEFPLPQKALDPIEPPASDGYEKKNYRGQEKNPENCAVILCKLRKPESLLELRAAKKYEARHQSDCYKVTWSELQALKDGLNDLVGYGVSSFSLANDKSAGTDASEKTL